MLNENIETKDVVGEKNPLGVKVELVTFSLVRLGLISDTNILLEAEEVDESTQNRRLLKISIYNLLRKF
jgi:hypothetical protein